MYDTDVARLKASSCSDTEVTGGHLSVFGVGVVMMFWQKLSLSVCLLFCFCCSLPAMIYFAGSEYSGGQTGVPIYLKGVCVPLDWIA